MEEEILISSNVEEVADAGVAAIDGLSAAIAGVSGEGFIGAQSAIDGLAASIAGIDTSALQDTNTTAGELAGASDGAASSIDGLAESIAGISVEPIEGATEATEELGKASEDAGAAGGESAAVTGNAYLSLAKKGLKVAKAIYGIAEAAVSATLDQVKLRESLVGALDQATKGRGTEAFDSLSAMARKLNLDVADTVGTFTELTKAGASNADATSLIKLQADIEAVGGSAGDAKAAVKRALDEIKSGKDAGTVIKKIAGEFGAVGNGANASAKASLTFTGALKRIEGAKDQAFADIAQAIMPGLDKVGAKLSSLFEGASLGDTGIIDGLVSAIDYIPSLIDGAVSAFGTLQDVAGPGIAALSSAFDLLGDAIGSTGGAGGAFKAVAATLGAVITVVATAIAGVVAAIAGMVMAYEQAAAAVGSVVDAVSGAIDTIAGFSLIDAGTNLINSFVDGMLGAIGGVVAAAASAGEAAAGALKSALGIASPSKIGTDSGDNLVMSTGNAAADAAPAAAKLVEAAGSVTGQAMIDGVSMGAEPAVNAMSLDGGMTDAPRMPKNGKAKGGASISITINQEIHGGGDAEEVARLCAIRSREELITTLQELGLA